MSLLSTLAKAAIGMAVAKQVGKVMKGKGGQARQQGGGLGDILGQLTKGKQQSQGGGLGDILGQVLGGGAQAQQQGGGLGDILGQLTKQGGGSAGGLGDILGQITGGRAAPSNNTSGGNGGILGQILGGGQATPAVQPGATGGNPLESILGGILGKTVTGQATAGGTAGGLGGLLESLTKQATGAGAAGAAGAGGLGELLNQAMSRFGEPEQKPTPEQDAAAGVLLSAMIQAAKSDGVVDEAEKEALFNNLGDEITQDEIEFLNQQMVKPVDPEGLAASIPPALRQQAYTMSLLVIDLDNQNEANYLHRFASALGIDQNTVNALHNQLGEPQLYA